MVIMWVAYILNNPQNYFSVAKSIFYHDMHANSRPDWSIALRTYFLAVFIQFLSQMLKGLPAFLVLTQIHWNLIGLISRALVLSRHWFKWLVKWQTKIRMRIHQINWNLRSTSLLLAFQSGCCGLNSFYGYQPTKLCNRSVLLRLDVWMLLVSVWGALFTP